MYRGKVNHELEREITRDFHLYSAPFPEAAGETELERLFVMQHFGMPTRLLDWTESHLTALYFAVVSHDSAASAAVFVLDPWRLNERSMGQTTVPTIGHPAIASYALGERHEDIDRFVAAKDPIAVRPRHATGRIRAQNGFFTIHGHDQRPLDQLALPGLLKIVIAGASKTDILRELLQAGVSPKTVFPDLSGLCEDIALRYSNRFMLEQAARPRTSHGRRQKAKSKPKARYVASARPIELTPGAGFSSRPAPTRPVKL